MDRHVAAGLGDETVILGLRTGEYHSLGGTGVRIWELLQEPRRFAELVEVIEAEFAVGRAQIETDLSTFLDRLEAAGLVEVARAT